MITLLVARLGDHPRQLEGFDRILSCGQYPRALEGLRCVEVHVDPHALEHRNFDKVAAALARNLEKQPR